MTIFAQDSFNRADNTTLGNTDNGQTWSGFGTGVLGISSNQAYLSTVGNDSFSYVDSLNTDVKISVNIAANTTGEPALYFRVVDATNYFRMIRSSGTIFLQRRVSGANTNVGSKALAYVANEKYSVVTKSDGTIECYVNDVLQLSATNASFTTSTKHGFGTGTGSAVTRWDNFLIESLTTGGTALTLSLSDSITLGESFAKQRQGYLSLGDNLTLSESFTKRRQAYLSLADGLTIGDMETSTRATINTLVRALSDSINITDSITIRAMRYLTIFDLFSIVDSIGTTGGGNVAQTIKFKRGNEVDLPTLAEGEPAITIDTNKMFVGTPNGNRQIATLLVVDSVANLPVADKSKQFLISGVLGGTGTADALYVCKKLSNDTYDWVQFV